MDFTDEEGLWKKSDEELLGYLDTSYRRIVLNILYERYEKKIYYKCISILKNEDEAKDLCHDIFIVIFTKLQQFKGNSKLSLWIHSISVNTCLKYLQKQKKLTLISINDVEQQLDKIEDEGENELLEKFLLESQLSELNTHVNKLREEEKLILIMFYMDNLSVKEVSEILSIGLSAAKMKLKRSRDKLLNFFMSAALQNGSHE